MPGMSYGWEWLITIVQLVWRMWGCLTAVRLDERCGGMEEAGEAAGCSGAGAGPIS
jgi:hypothetical protein